MLQVDAEEDEEEEEDAMDKRQKLQQKWRVVCIMSAADAELQGVARKERIRWVQLESHPNITWQSLTMREYLLMAHLPFGKVSWQSCGYALDHATFYNNN